MSLNENQLSRKRITKYILQKESTKWNAVISNKDPKALWLQINWKGNLNDNSIKQHPTINELKTHFENIYHTEDIQEL